MAAKRDYYEVLGVGKNATADEIKSAYRKLALKWHPDRWVSGTDAEKKTAEDNFKEASEAYSVLSDPQKKARYDQFGFAGMDGGSAGGFDAGGFDINDILRSVFGEGFSGFGNFGGFSGFGFGGDRYSGGEQGKRVLRGRDIQTTVTLTLEEIAKGCTKEVSIERNRPCGVCGGKGARNESDIHTCPTCGGSGQVQRIQRVLFAQTVSYSTCPDCGGRGKTISAPCPACRGTGLERKRETVRVEIPAGVEAGMQMTVPREGHSAPDGGINGDLLVVIKEAPHKYLERDGSNLFYSHTISVIDAMLGTEIKVPGIEKDHKVKIEPGTQSGSTLRLRGCGLPAVKGYGRGTGDLYVKINVWVPRSLSRSEKEALQKLRESSSFEPSPSREDRELFERMKSV